MNPTVVICLSLALGLTGCGSEVKVPWPVNTLTGIVHSDPQAEFALDHGAVLDRTDPNKPLLQWSQDVPGMQLRAQPQFPVVENDSAVSTEFSYEGLPAPTGDVMQGSLRSCTNDCTGQTLRRVDEVRRKLLFDLAMRFDAAYVTCSTRYSRMYHFDESSFEYTACSGSCSDIAAGIGCCCRELLPCGGLTGHFDEPQCVNPDFHPAKVSVSVTAHAELANWF